MNALKKSVIENIKLLSGLPYRRTVAGMRDFSEHEFWAFQYRAFDQLYSDAVRHVPYYRQSPKSYPIVLPDEPDIQQLLTNIPILPKSEVKADPSRFWRQPSLFGTAEHTTGGTTGTPLRIRASLSERGFTNAILEDRYLDLVGQRNPRIMRLSGFLDRDVGGGGIFMQIPGTPYSYLSIYDLSLDRKDEIIEVVERFQPRVIHGYASALHQFSLLFKGGRSLQLEQPLAVVSTSETLLPNQREDIESFLSAKVFNEYGSQEGQHLILECRAGSLHIHPARGIVEILRMDSDEPAKAGELGRVVVTGLANRSMPLIRYELGGAIESTGYDSGCSCGCAWPTTGTVYGRSEDLVRTRDGRRIGLLSHSTLKDWEGIRESQIIQTDYDYFTYLIAPQDFASFDYSGLEAHVKKQLRNRIGEAVHAEFRYVDEVPRTAAGKFRTVVVDMVDGC